MNQSVPPLILGRHILTWGNRSYVMGVVNVAPDSFSGDGLRSAAEALSHGRRMVEEGADLLDVGGESTRPRAAPISPDEERRRVLPAVEALAASLSVPISVDTSKAAIAEEALTAGARLINDVSGLLGDPQMASVVARTKAGLVLMANHRFPLPEPEPDVIAATRKRWQAGLALAAAAGVDPAKIIVDPGLGFGLRPVQSLALVRRLGELREVRHPMLIAASRKGFVGHPLGDAPVSERLEGSLAVAALAIAAGVSLIRAHDVRATHRVRLVADAICHAKA
jgi:dihydropteroate synthase